MAAVGGGDGDGLERQVGGDLTCAQSGPSCGDYATLSDPHERNARWAMMTDPAGVVGVEPGNSNQLSFLNYRDLRDSQIFTDLVGSRLTVLNLRSGEQVQRVNGLAVTANFFEGLGIGAGLGRVFTRDEAAPEREPRLAVLSYAYWQRRFAGDPVVLGQALNLNGQAFLVLGVLPQQYRPVTGFMAPDVYVPLSALVLPISTGEKTEMVLPFSGVFRHMRHSSRSGPRSPRWRNNSSARIPKRTRDSVSRLGSSRCAACRSVVHPS